MFLGIEMCAAFILAVVCYIMYELNSIFPTKAGVCDWFSINMVLNFTASLLNKALNHNAFNNVDAGLYSGFCYEVFQIRFLAVRKTFYQNLSGWRHTL